MIVAEHSTKAQSFTNWWQTWLHQIPNPSGCNSERAPQSGANGSRLMQSVQP